MDVCVRSHECKSFPPWQAFISLAPQMAKESIQQSLLAARLLKEFSRVRDADSVAI